VWLREVAGTSDKGDWVELDFTAFQVSESRVTSAFRPPADCGSPRPSEDTSAHPCPTSVTTPRGRVIHHSDDKTPAFSTIDYVVLDKTLVAIRIDTTRFRGDLAGVVDAFEPVSVPDLARLVDDTFRERELIRTHPSRLLSFTPYVPGRVPSGYTPVVVAFDNPRDIRSPYLVMRWESEHAELTVKEFALPGTFHPPDSCGPDDPERYLELPCTLRMTTRGGMPVYAGAGPSPARVAIGNTMVVITHSLHDDRALGQLVDSLRPKEADLMRQIACDDRESC
jgi:hypothetical protein